MAAPYPWQSAVWRRLWSSRTRMAHALLLQGAAGTGKLAFAQAFAQSLLCQAPMADGKACDTCPSCGWYVQGSHPDFRLLMPEQDLPADEEAPAATSAKSGKKTQISVAQVRDLADFLGLTSHSGNGIRIILVAPAEALNPASANALLKMLEEPPAGVLFMLVSHQPHRLLPTIISRCQQIDMPMPDPSSAVEWLTAQGVSDAQRRLAYAGGSPLTAIEQVELHGTALGSILKHLALGVRADAFVLAPLLASIGMASAIAALQKWAYDLLSSRLAHTVRYHLGQEAVLQELSKSVDLGLLLDFQRRLNEAFASATHPLNHELQLESLMLQYAQLFKAK